MDVSGKSGAVMTGDNGPGAGRTARLPLWAVALLLLLAVAPLLWPTIPPLVDLPNHMSRYAIGADYAASPRFRQWYDFHWRFVGNLGVDIPATLLGRVIGVEAATRIVIAATPLIAVAGMIWLSRVVHGRLSPSVPLAAIFAYNYAFNFGFVNFTLAAALCFGALALWIDLGQRGRTALRAAIFVPLALVIWLAHTVGWGLLGLIVFAAEFATRREARVPVLRAGWQAGLSCLVLCAPLVPMAFWYVASMQGAPSAFHYRISRKLAYVILSLRNYNRVVDAATVLAVAGICVAGLARRQFRADRRLLYPALLIFAVYVVMPDALLGSGFTDLRIIPYGIALGVLSLTAVRASRLVTMLTCAAWLLLAARTAYVAVTYAWLSNHYERILAALDHVPVGAKVFGAARVACFRDPYDDRLDHIHRIATVRRHAFTNSTWPPVASQTLSVRPYLLQGYTDVDSQRMETEQCRHLWFEGVEGSVVQVQRSPYEYYWLIGFPPRDWPKRPWLRPVWHGEDTVLYRIDRRAAAAAPQPGLAASRTNSL